MQQEDLLAFDQFLDRSDQVIGVAAIILDDQLDLAAVDAALTVDLVVIHLCTVDRVKAVGHDRPRQRGKHADTDGVLGQSGIRLCDGVRGKTDGERCTEHGISELHGFVSWKEYGIAPRSPWAPSVSVWRRACSTMELLQQCTTDVSTSHTNRVAT